MQKARSIITPQRVAQSASMVTGLAIVAYFLFRLLPLFLAPKLVWVGPAQAVVQNPEYMLHGSVDAHARLTVNQEDLSVDGNGNFQEVVRLVSGLNIINVTATGRFGRKTEITKYIIYQNN